MNIEESFNILNLSPNASLEEIRRAYKAEVVKWHPDKYQRHSKRQSMAEERIKQINLAYEQIREYLKHKRSEPSPSNTTTASSKAAEPPVDAWVVLDQWINKLILLYKKVSFRPPYGAGQTSTLPPNGVRAKKFKQILEEKVSEQKQPTRCGMYLKSGLNKNGIQNYRRYGPTTRNKRNARIAPIQSIRPVSEIDHIGNND